MTETAARPWWADVQHLRPRDDREAPATTRSWADDAGFTDALSGDSFAGIAEAAFGSDAWSDAVAATADAGGASVAVLDLPAVEEALAAVDIPLPLDFDVDDVDW